MTTTIPCRRPRVEYDVEAQTHICRVPRCGWTFRSVKSAQEPGWHRAAHRDAVPATRIERDQEYDVYCTPCGGHRRTLGTRAEAQAWLDDHLSTEHGLVVCP